MKAARNIKQVVTTWGEFKLTDEGAEQTFNASAMQLTDDREVILHQENTPFGTVTHLIEWK